MHKRKTFIFVFGLTLLAIGLLFGALVPYATAQQATVSVDLKADGQDGPITIPYNTSVFLSWTTENASSCRASGDWSGVRSLNGAQSPARITSPKTFTLTCDGISDSVSVTPTDAPIPPPGNPPTQLPTVTINAFPSTISTGEASALTWQSTDAQRCTASSGWSGSKSLYGNRNVRPNFTTTYTIVCTNTAGSASDSTTVTVQNPQGAAPAVNIDAQPRNIAKGETSVLTWDSTNAQRCLASGGWSGTKPTSGTKSVQPKKLALYTITCSNEFGSTSANVNVFMRNTTQPKPTISFQARPSIISKGQESVLVWSTTNADKCFATGSWSGRKSTSGAETVSPNQTTTYTLTCTNDDGSTTFGQTISIRSTTPPPPAITNFVASCVASPSQTTIGRRISFAAGQTGGVLPVTYNWTGDISGAGQLQSAIFTAAGTKRATVTITDRNGRSRQASCSTLIVPAVISAAARPTPPPPSITKPRPLPEILTYRAIIINKTQKEGSFLASIFSGTGNLLWFIFLILLNIALIFWLIAIFKKFKEEKEKLEPQVAIN